LIGNNDSCSDFIQLKGNDMTRRSIVVAVVAVFVLASTTAATAAEPIIGSWKLDISTSKFASNSAAPKEQSEVYREISGGKIELTYTSIGADGASSNLLIIFPAQGGANSRSQGIAKGLLEVETRINAHEWHMTRMQNGKQILTLQKVISTDGKTMRVTETGTDSKGKPYVNHMVYKKQ
jgi:hypothetical protein